MCATEECCADKLDGEKDKQSILDELQTRRELLPKLSKEKWLSLDMHAETIGGRKRKTD